MQNLNRSIKLISNFGGIGFFGFILFLFFLIFQNQCYVEMECSFVWVQGSNTTQSVTSQYERGRLDNPNDLSPFNFPPGRYGFSWIQISNGYTEYILFGGLGYTLNKNFTGSYLNDVWLLRTLPFDKTSSISSPKDSPVSCKYIYPQTDTSFPNYTSNIFGGRYYSSGFQVSSSEVIIIGGAGYSEDGVPDSLLSDVWLLNFTSGVFKAVRYEKEDEEPIYGAIKFLNDSSVNIGGRYHMIGLKIILDYSLYFFIFGGITKDGKRNDAFLYSTEAIQFGWSSGSNKPKQKGHATNTPNNYSSENLPGARYGSVGWTQYSSSSSSHSIFVYIFGGMGLDLSLDYENGYLSDLWSANVSAYKKSSTILISNTWAFLGGNILIDQKAKKVTANNVYNSQNIPGGRYVTSATLMNDDEVCLFGGEGYSFSNPMYGVMNDLWCYSFKKNMWKFLYNGVSEEGVNSVFYYGDFNVYDEQNRVLSPARSDHAIWAISETVLAVVGGYSNLAYFMNDIFYITISNCFGKSSFSNSVCDGKGVCLSNDNCSCSDFQSSKVLEDCADSCFGFSIHDPDRCNGHGECLHSTLCSCQEGYYGDQCEVFSCFKIWSNSSKTLLCNGRGDCVSTDLCECYNNYFYDGKNNCDFNSQFFLIILVMSGAIIFLIFVIVVLFFIFLIICVYSKQRKKILQFEEIEDIYVLLEENKVSSSGIKNSSKGNNTNQNKSKMSSFSSKTQTGLKKRKNKFFLNMDQEFFKVNYSDLKLIEMIGEGNGNAQVFLCKWKDDVSVALKMFKINHSNLSESESDVLKDFEKELLLISSLHHPYILRFLGAVMENQKFGILTELCECDFETYIKRCNSKNFKGKNYNLLNKNFANCDRFYDYLDFKEKIRILMEVSSAMTYIHSNKIMHRDIKPKNILITKNKEGRLTDFGLSKIIESINNYNYKNSNNTNSTCTVHIGTSFYMAPETVMNSNIPYDNKCDVFSFGMMTFVCLTEYFSNPFLFKDKTDLENEEQTSNQNLEFRMAKDPHFRPKIPPHLMILSDFFDSMWQGDPSKRPDFVQIHNNLKEILSNSIYRIDSSLKRNSTTDIGEQSISDLKKELNNMKSINLELSHSYDNLLKKYQNLQIQILNSK